MPAFTRETVSERVEQYAEAWVENDLEKLLDCFTEDAMYVERPGKQNEGHEEIGAMWSKSIFGRQTNVAVDHHADEMVFDKENHSAVAKWDATFAKKFEDGKVGRAFNGTWNVTLRFRQCDDKQWRICWYEEYWHKIEEEGAKRPFKGRKGKGKGRKGKGKGKGGKGVKK